MFVEFCHHAHLGVRLESGSGLELSHTWPADVLVLNWERGKHAAFVITVTSPLIPSILTAASLSEGAAAEEYKGEDLHLYIDTEHHALISQACNCGSNLWVCFLCWSCFKSVLHIVLCVRY